MKPCRRLGFNNYIKVPSGSVAADAIDDPDGADDCISQVTVNPDHLCNFSDHFVISFDIPCYLPSTPNPKPLHIFDYTKANFNDLCSFLLDFDFSICLQSLNLEAI